MKKETHHHTIRNWAEDDRPREKMVMKGRQSLSDAELLAILIVSGTRYESAVDLARNILEKAGGNLSELARLNVQELTRIDGIGPTRAITILAALELGRRRNESEVVAKESIRSARDAWEIFRSAMGDKPWEEFWILLLNRANKIIRKLPVSEGGLSGTVVDPKKIFKICLDHHASGIIMGHNHPSGSLTPSDADVKITKKLTEAGRLLEITILDHIIVGENGYYSFAEDGKI